MKPGIAAASLLVLCALSACPDSPPETPAELAQAAAQLHRGQQYERAIELYRRSLELHDDAGVRANLARALAAAGNAAEAAREYQRLLKDQPQNGTLWHDYGLLLATDPGDLQGAEEALFNATKYPPKPAEASYDLGRVLMQRGRYEEAGACFDAALSLAPPQASWLADAEAQQVQAYLLARQQKPPPR